MKILSLTVSIALLISAAISSPCENYQKKIKTQDYLDITEHSLACLAKKAKSTEKVYDIIEITKIINTLKIECFSQMTNPSEEAIDFFQCLKNYYEAKFDISLQVPSLKNEEKGTDSQYYDDEELLKKLQDEKEARNEPTNIALYIFCVVLGIGIASLLIATIYSRYRIYLNKDRDALGQSSMEFGSSSQKYQVQKD